MKLFIETKDVKQSLIDELDQGQLAHLGLRRHIGSLFDALQQWREDLDIQIDVDEYTNNLPDLRFFSDRQQVKDKAELVYYDYHEEAERPIDINPMFWDRLSIYCGLADKNKEEIDKALNGVALITVNALEPE